MYTCHPLPLVPREIKEKEKENHQKLGKGNTSWQGEEQWFETFTVFLSFSPF